MDTGGSYLRCKIVVDCDYFMLLRSKHHHVLVGWLVL